MYRQRAQVAARSYIHIHTSSTLVSPARLKSLPAYASAHTYSLFFLSFCGALKLQPASTRPRRGHRVTGSPLLIDRICPRLVSNGSTFLVYMQPWLRRRPAAGLNLTEVMFCI
ncbi:unnamed protein product [Trichogramma brassicae]|uniref:Uncharacterized protein n=1 Tax=Trichogramma brassicae TaxID=86971 RepID=A0A6H5ITN9_9HYME|nr:unnamed protein product [Trichogramma brassicae]